MNGSGSESFRLAAKFEKVQHFMRTVSNSTFKCLWVKIQYRGWLLDCDNQEYVVRSLGILTPEPLECPALYPGQVNVLFHQKLFYFYLIPKGTLFSFLSIVKKFILSKHNRHSFFKVFPNYWTTGANNKITSWKVPYYLQDALRIFTCALNKYQLCPGCYCFWTVQHD